MADQDEEFVFIPPPEAPVFEPTEEEFQDPLAYIAKIRPYAEKVGICKIRPPPEWQPPFSVDVENFKFTPRVQRLNELEARTRVKLNFLDALAKFWELQGTSFKIPIVERKSLDLFRLYKTVHGEGGFEYVTRKKKWSNVARKMSYNLGKSAPTMLRINYEKYLYPYDIFQAGAFTGEPLPRAEDKKQDKDKDYMPNGASSNTSYQVSRKSKRARLEEVHYPETIDYNTNPELRKLKFLAPGPKMAGLPVVSTDAVVKEEPRYVSVGDYRVANVPTTKMASFSPKKQRIEEEAAISPMKLSRMSGSVKQTTASPGKRSPKQKDSEKLKMEAIQMGKEPELTRRRPVRQSSRTKYYEETQDEYVCQVCSKGNSEESMLLCDGCDDSYHTYCLIPPLPSVPKGDWRCPRCVAEECNKPQEAFGFEQAKKEYSLQSFGEKADTFKKNYFKMPPEEVPTEVVEKEFWRLVSTMDEEVAVEYGADLHTVNHGSGFPRKCNAITSDEERYVNSPWNLNNLANLERSVLSHISADISGMKVPWIYVGMCFASFCWHNEDHWSYSINYMHWGDPKTWYGVPGGSAQDFERVMKEAAPELFEAQPDLLHQLVTIISPNALTAKGVPVVRTNQYAGEFVITFPRAYHAGFNHGYNLAEAVNFATADWLPIGRLCIDHYRHMARCPVFSHEELVCKMAADPDGLDLDLAKAVYDELSAIVNRETKRRMKLLKVGASEFERGEAFELLPDDERKCGVCNTTCFLSAAQCSCNSERLSCIECASELCSCAPSKRILKYRYTLQELPSMLYRLKLRADSFDNWAREVKRALDPLEHKVDVSELRELVTTAEQSQFPDCEFLQKLKAAVTEAERCANVAVQLVNRKHRTRHANTCVSSTQPARLSLDELQAFMLQLESLPCVVQEAELVQDLMSHVESFQNEAQKVLQDRAGDVARLGQLLDTGITLDVDLPEIPKLKQELRQVRWLDQVNATLIDTEAVSFDVLRDLLNNGTTLVQKPAVEKSLGELRELVNLGERWEEKAKVCLQARPRHVMATVETIVQEASHVPVYLPNVSALKESLRKAREWSDKVDQVQNDEYYPYLEVLEALVMRGRPIPVRLEQLPQMESQVAAARAWRDRAARTFLKKNSSATLSEVLSPRKDVGVYKLCTKPRKKRDKEKEREKEDKEVLIDLAALDEFIGRDPAKQIADFRESERKELDMLHKLRAANVARQKDEDTKRRCGENVVEGQYCVCRRGPDGFMLQCELCKEWFHGSCVPLPRSQGGKSMGKSSAAIEAAKELKYMCPLCQRSRRPRLETILSLLVSLQKLPVRLPEGEALQFLTERAMNWQDRCRQFLAGEQVADLLTFINNAESSVEDGGSVLREISTESLSASAALLRLAHSGSPPGGSSPSNSPTEGSIHVDVVSNDVPQPISRRCPLLSEDKRQQAEVLMMEGDILEVTLDETEQFWRILLSQKSQEEQEMQMFEVKSNKEKPKRKRKKKPEEEDKTKQVKTAQSTTAKNGAEALVTVVKRRKKEKNKEKMKRAVKQEEVIDVEDDDDDDDDDDDEDEACAAPICRRPTGDEVGWVQCDQCQLWFHLACVGLSSEKAESMDSYHCRLCSKATSETNSVVITPQPTSPAESVHIDVDSNTPTGSNPGSPVSAVAPLFPTAWTKAFPRDVTQDVVITPSAVSAVEEPSQLNSELNAQVKAQVKAQVNAQAEDPGAAMDTS